MRLPKRGEKGFTLIELLIVVAILGVLAAVVIPNVGQFIGAGKEEAADTEFANVQTAVIAMMVDNQLSELTNPVDTIRTNKMSEFPDEISSWDAVADPLQGKKTDPDGVDYAAGDKAGYILYGHDIHGGDGVPPVGGAAPLVSYVAAETTAYWYTVDESGTVTQYPTAPTP